MAYTMQDLILEYSNPNNQWQNAVRAGVNQGVASGSQSLATMGSNLGWGKGSPLMAKMQTMNQGQGLNTLGQQFGQMEQSRMNNLGQAVTASAGMDLQRDQMAQEWQMFLQQMELERKRIEAQEQSPWWNILSSLLGAGGQIGGAYVGGKK